MESPQIWYIYKLTCKETNKSYVGQTQKYKYKSNKPYNYGLSGRWCDHVSSSKNSTTPLHVAMREYTFSQELLETVESECHIDEREAHWIRELGTTVPNGYNVAEHSRCKHRGASNSAASIYLDCALSVELKHVHKDGIPRLVYLYIDTADGRKRMTFGQSKTSTFEEALKEANECIQIFQNNGITILNSDKKAQFEGQVLQKVRIVPFNKTMIAIYITTDKNKKRICFGGKNITYQDAVKSAKEFISGLKIEVLEDNS